LNSPPPSFFIIPSSPHSWNSFNRSHFSIYIRGYTAFAPYPPPTLSPPPPPHWFQPPPPRQDLFCPPVL
jgi:hypothetical protein